MLLTFDDIEILNIIKECPLFIKFVPAPTTEMKLEFTKGVAVYKPVNDLDLDEILPVLDIITQISLIKQTPYTYSNNLSIEAQILVVQLYSESTFFIDISNELVQMLAVKVNIKNLINMKHPSDEVQIYVANTLKQMGRLPITSMRSRYPILFSKIRCSVATEILYQAEN